MKPRIHNLYHDTLYRIDDALFILFDRIADHFQMRAGYHHCLHISSDEEIKQMLKRFNEMFNCTP